MHKIKVSGTVYILGISNIGIRLFLNRLGWNVGTFGI